MDEAITGDPNQPLIDDPTILSYLDDLDHGLLARHDVDDPNFRSSLDALDRGLSGERASPHPETLPPIVPQQQPPRSEPLDERLHLSPARPAPGASAAGGRPLLDLFPIEPASVRHATGSPVQPRASALRSGASKAPIQAFNDVPAADLDDASFAADLKDDHADAGARRSKRLGFAAYLVVMMLLGAALGALVFQARLSRIFVQWQSVSTSVSPPTATPVNHD